MEGIRVFRCHRTHQTLVHGRRRSYFACPQLSPTWTTSRLQSSPQRPSAHADVFYSEVHKHAEKRRRELALSAASMAQLPGLVVSARRQADSDADVNLRISRSSRSGSSDDMVTVLQPWCHRVTTVKSLCCCTRNFVRSNI